MDNTMIQLVARLKIRFRQDKSISINTQRFFSESSYAAEILDSAEESDDVQLVALALELRNSLSHIHQPAAARKPVKIAPSLVTAGSTGTNPERYKFGARS